MGFTKWFSDLWYVYTGRNCGCEQRKVRLIRWLSRRCIARWFRSRWWWFWHVTVNRALRAVWQRWLIGAYYTGRQKPPGGDWQ